MKNVEEVQYLDELQSLIDTGRKKNDRTGVRVLSNFGTVHWQFDLQKGKNTKRLLQNSNTDEFQFYNQRDTLKFIVDTSSGNFPLLTTKRMRFDIVAKEILWMISGSTNAKRLSRDGIKTWDLHSSRDFLDNNGFDMYKKGDLGPSYGHQWRHNGVNYKGIGVNYSGQGIDQLEHVIDLIKYDPDSRRIILANWVPQDIARIPLPPCMLHYQFDVGVNGELSCLASMRSGDMGIGVPYNIAQRVLLTCLIAHVTGLNPHKLSLVIGNSHVYSNHVDGLKKQLTREPKQFPTFEIIREINNIDEFKFDDLALRNYTHHEPILLKLAQ